MGANFPGDTAGTLIFWRSSAFSPHFPGSIRGWFRNEDFFLPKGLLFDGLQRFCMLHVTKCVRAEAPTLAKTKTKPQCVLEGCTELLIFWRSLVFSQHLHGSIRMIGAFVSLPFFLQHLFPSRFDFLLHRFKVCLPFHPFPSGASSTLFCPTTARSPLFDRRKNSSPLLGETNCSWAEPQIAVEGLIRNRGNWLLGRRERTRIHIVSE